MRLSEMNHFSLLAHIPLVTKFLTQKYLVEGELKQVPGESFRIIGEGLRKKHVKRKYVKCL